jgi:hypothetical protein
LFPTQQLADVNQDWYPKWCSDDVKYCIVRDCIGHSYKLTVEECTNRYHFLAFKTREDAELFLENNDEELFRKQSILRGEGVEPPATLVHETNLADLKNSFLQ